MEGVELKAVPGSGTQQTTGTPQTAGKPGVSGTRASSLQPGTAPNLLNGRNGGIELRGTDLPTVSLEPAATTVQTTPKAAASVAAVTKPYHFNSLFIALPVLLVLMTLLTAWRIARSAKNTTNY